MDNLKALIPGMAKAEAAFVAPFVLLPVAWIATKAGVPVDIPLDQVETWVQTLILALVTALGVYQTPNRPAE